MSGRLAVWWRYDETRFRITALETTESEGLKIGAAARWQLEYYDSGSHPSQAAKQTAMFMAMV